jgi:hypothetical protein
MPPLQPGEADFPRVAPNFVIELRSDSDSASDVHEKMLSWMFGGVDVSRLISGGYFANLLIKYYQHLSRKECQLILSQI